ncbi:hypothetical protein HDU91_005018 [Kappamyces sp. JEL0680]|nr:hypothetical protein HDU91_005018 [Kappamyces sp. JEL0680]
MFAAINDPLQTLPETYNGPGTDLSRRGWDVALAALVLVASLWGAVISWTRLEASSLRVVAKIVSLELFVASVLNAFKLFLDPASVTYFWMDYSRRTLMLHGNNLVAIIPIYLSWIGLWSSIQITLRSIPMTAFVAVAILPPLLRGMQYMFMYLRYGPVQPQLDQYSGSSLFLNIVDLVLVLYYGVLCLAMIASSVLFYQKARANVFAAVEKNALARQASGLARWTTSMKLIITLSLGMSVFVTTLFVGNVVAFADSVMPLDSRRSSQVEMLILYIDYFTVIPKYSVGLFVSLVLRRVGTSYERNLDLLKDLAKEQFKKSTNAPLLASSYDSQGARVFVLTSTPDAAIELKPVQHHLRRPSLDISCHSPFVSATPTQPQDLSFQQHISEKLSSRLGHLTHRSNQSGPLWGAIDSTLDHELGHGVTSVEGIDTNADPGDNLVSLGLRPFNHL